MVAASNYSRCSGVDIIHTLKVSVENTTAHNVYIEQHYSLVAEMQQQCYKGDLSISTGDSALLTGTIIATVLATCLCCACGCPICSWLAIVLVRRYVVRHRRISFEIAATTENSNGSLKDCQPRCPSCDVQRCASPKLFNEQVFEKEISDTAMSKDSFGSLKDVNKKETTF